MAQYYCKVDNLFIVGPGCFKPAPKVDSAIVRLEPYKELPYPANDVKLLERVVREAFQQRRKTMRNTLKKLISADELTELSIDPTSRPETVTLPEFVAIANYLHASAKNN